jgi:hypothetical protein
MALLFLKQQLIYVVISLANGTKIEFYDVYIFSNTARSGKVKEIKTYRP